MHKRAVGGKEGGGDRRRRRMGSRTLQDIRSLQWPLPPHLVLILHFTAGEAPDHGKAMRNTLLSMLATLMCTLAACVDVTPMRDFDLEKAAGKWYMVGFATNAQWFVNHKAGMKMGTAMLVPTAGGDLDLSYANLNADGTCWRMTHLAKKTETPGRFTFRSQVWNNENDMRIVDVVYNDYALVHTIKTKDGVSEVLNKLYSRTTEANTVMQQKFMQFSLETGILADNIVMLPQNAECPEV